MFIENRGSDFLFIVCVQDALEKMDFSFRRKNVLEKDPERSLSIHLVEWKFGTLQGLGESLKCLGLDPSMLLSPNLGHKGFLSCSVKQNLLLLILIMKS